MTDSDRPDLSHLDGEERVQAEQLLEMAGLREFDQELPSALGDAERNGTMLSLFALDIAELILINDEHGHAAGDRVLARTAQVLVDTLAEKGNVYRVGGDEFWAIVPELPAERVEALASEAAESVAAATRNTRSTSPSLPQPSPTVKASKRYGPDCPSRCGAWRCRASRHGYARRDSIGSPTSLIASSSVNAPASVRALFEALKRACVGPTAA